MTLRERINEVLDSEYALMFYTLLAFMFYELNISELTFFMFGLLVFYTCFFRDDLTPLYVIPLFVLISTSNGFVASTFSYVVFAISGALALPALIYFFIKQFAVNKKKLKLGKLFWPLVAVVGLSFVAGWGSDIYQPDQAWKFQILAVAVLAFYEVLLNFTKPNAKNYVIGCFIAFCFLAIFQMVAQVLLTEDFMGLIESKGFQIGNGNMINQTALIFSITIPLTLSLALESDKPWLWVLVAVCIGFALIATGSRANMMFGAIAGIAGFIYLLIKLKKNKAFMAFGYTCIAAAVVFAVLGVTLLKDSLFSWVFDRGFTSSGRVNLYNIALEMFAKYPILGTGLFAADPALGFNTCMYMYHSLFFQTLACGGMVGLAVVVYYYIGKFQIMCKKFTSFKYFGLLSVLAFEAYAMVDMVGLVASMVLVGLMPLIIMELEPQEQPKNLLKGELINV